MTTTQGVRYTTRPDQADENERLIRAVFDQLESASPDGLHYAALRLDDGASFRHVALLDDGDNPLPRMGRFGESQPGIGGRCPAPPVAADGTVVGLRGLHRLTGPPLVPRPSPRPGPGSVDHHARADLGRRQVPDLHQPGGQVVAHRVLGVDVPGPPEP